MPENEYEYETSMKAYRDIKNSLDTKWEEGLETGREEGLKVGREEGLKEGRGEGLKEGRGEGLKEGRGEGQKAEKIETAKHILAKGFQTEDVMEFTGLTREEIEKLKGK